MILKCYYNLFLQTLSILIPECRTWPPSCALLNSHLQTCGLLTRTWSAFGKLSFDSRWNLFNPKPNGHDTVHFKKRQTTKCWSANPVATPSWAILSPSVGQKCCLPKLSPNIFKFPKRLFWKQDLVIYH